MKRVIKVVMSVCIFLSSSLVSIKANNEIQPYSYSTAYLNKTERVYTTLNNVSNTYYVELQLCVKVNYNAATGEIASVGQPSVNITASYIPSGYKLGTLVYNDIRSATINSNNTVTAIAGVRIPILTSTGSSTSYAFSGGTAYHYINFINQSV